MPGAPVDGEDDSATPGPAPGGATLREVLESARRAGYLGPGPLEPQVRHAEAFALISRRLASEGGVLHPRLVDLGSGGGLPGLVVAAVWPEARIVLVEANGRRASFLRTALRDLDLEERASVVAERAEAVGRTPEQRGAFDGVTARSFGRPAVVAECAAPLLRVGGWLLVSEPPTRTDGAGMSLRGIDPRWPSSELVQFGLKPVEAVHEPFGFQVLRQVVLSPERFPRRDGVPAKRPLF